MVVDSLILGEFQTNCYIVRSSDSANDCVVIDPGLDADALLDYLEQKNLKPLAVILTHGHIDHIAGIEKLRSRYPQIKIYIHKLDAELLSNPAANLSFMTGLSFITDKADCTVEEGDIIDQAGITLQVLHTPGHTPGGMCLYAEDEGIVFAGDTLFADSVGRTDFPNGSMSQLLRGIRENLFTLPDKTTVYPGHGPKTTIVREKKYNPFLQ